MKSNQSKKFSMGTVTLLMLLLIGVALPGEVFAQHATKSATGINHSLSITSDGSVFGWGSGGSGELGNGIHANSTYPISAEMSGALAGKTVTDLVGGDFFTLALTSDGKLYSWGTGTAGQLGAGSNTSSNVPVAVDMTGVLSGKTMTAVSSGMYYSLALASDGTVYGWGSGNEGEFGAGAIVESNVPVATDMSGVLAGKTVTAISAGYWHGLVLTSDGGLYSFGYNQFGQLGVNPDVTWLTTVPIAVDMSGVLAGKTVTAISAGGTHNLVLTSDGSVFGWGHNVKGELGNGTGVTSWAPVAVDMSGVLNGKTVTALSTGYNHSLVLTSDSGLYTWGENTEGQLGNGSNTQSLVPVAVDMSGALTGKTPTAVSAGWSHNVALANDGTVYSWGRNTSGQLGDSTSTSSNVPVAVNSFGAAGPTQQTFTVLGAVGTEGDTDPYIQALAEGATEWTQAYLIGAHPWGFVEGTNSWLNFDPSNEVGLNTRTPYRIRFNVPADYTDPSMVFQVKADNRAVIWINDTYIDSIEGSDTPNVPDAIVEQALNVGLNEIRITMVDWGSIVGLNYRIDVTMTSAEDISDAVLTPEDASALNHAPIAAAGDDQSVGVASVTLDGSGSSDEDGNLLSYSWSENGSEIATGVTPTVTLAAGSHTITLTVSDGELSDTDEVTVNYTVMLPTMDDPLAAGDGHSLFRADDGSLHSWGLNAEGQLGNASMTSNNFPVAVDMSGVLAGKTIASVVSGESYSLALTTDGGLYGWGRNNHGQLGDGTTVSSTVPVAVDMSGALSGKTIVGLTAGTYHVLALANDGSVYGWGYNGDGELGDGSTTSSTVPVAVDMTGVLSGKSVTAMAAGSGHSVVLADDGNLYSWGANNFGQLGNNSGSQSNVPVAVVMNGVLAGKTVTSLTAVYVHNLVLCSDGTVYGWGANVVGELGDGSGVSQSVPVATYMDGVLSGKTVTALTSGLIHTLALTSDGNLYTWGDGADGRLGNGSSTGSFVPVAVTMDGVLAGKTLTDIDAGWHHNIARDSDGNVFTWGKNDHGQLGDASNTSSNVPVAVTFIEPPAVASSPVPMGGATGVAMDQDLSWSASSEATGYTFSFGTDNPPTSIVNASDLGDVLSYSPASLDYSTTYYWSVTPYNLAGDASGVQVWSFTTMDDQMSDVELTLTPIEGSETIPITGGRIYYDINMVNTTEEWIGFRAGIFAMDSEGSRYGALEPSPITIWLEPGEVLERSLSQNVPAWIPGGDYSFYCLIGNATNSRIDSSGFTGTKLTEDLTGANPGDEVLDWDSFYTDTGALIMANDLWNSEGSFREDGSEITTASTLAVGDQVLPESNSLDQNFPNPFNPSTTISFALKTASDVSLRVYNLNGAEIAQVASGHYEAGHYSLNFSPENISSGTYIYVLDTGSFREVKRMVYLK